MLSNMQVFSMVMSIAFVLISANLVIAQVQAKLAK